MGLRPIFGSQKQKRWNIIPRAGNLKEVAYILLCVLKFILGRRNRRPLGNLRIFAINSRITYHGWIQFHRGEYLDPDAGTYEMPLMTYNLPHLLKPEMGYAADANHPEPAPRLQSRCCQH